MWVTPGSRIHGRNRNIFNQLRNSSYQLDTSARPSPQMAQDQNQNSYYPQSQLSKNFLLQSTFYLLPESTFLYILIWWLKKCWLVFSRGMWREHHGPQVLFLLSSWKQQFKEHELYAVSLSWGKQLGSTCRVSTARMLGNFWLYHCDK